MNEERIREIEEGIRDAADEASEMAYLTERKAEKAKAKSEHVENLSRKRHAILNLDRTTNMVLARQADSIEDQNDVFRETVNIGYDLMRYIKRHALRRPDTKSLEGDPVYDALVELRSYSGWEGIAPKEIVREKADELIYRMHERKMTEPEYSAILNEVERSIGTDEQKYLTMIWGIGQLLTGTGERSSLQDTFDELANGD